MMTVLMEQRKQALRMIRLQLTMVMVLLLSGETLEKNQTSV